MSWDAESIIEAIKADIPLQMALVALLFDLLMGWVWPARMNWDADFAGLPPIELPDGRKLETLLPEIDPVALTTAGA